MTEYAVPPSPRPSLAIVGSSARFPVRRIYCVGRNYDSPLLELDAAGDLRAPPLFFQKPADAVVESGATVPYPPLTENLHHEVELVAAIGTGGADIPESEALNHVAFYGVGIDLTRRDLQVEAKRNALPWAMAKGFDHSAPIGPLTPAEAAGHGPREISLSVDRTPRQRASTSRMAWSVAEIVAHLSRSVRLAPGDLVLTGTPEGAAAVTPGAVLEARGEGLAPLVVTIGAPGAAPTRPAAAAEAPPDPRRQIIDACLEMNRSGLNQGTSGNVSVRDGDGLLITPSGMPYDRMRPEHIVRMGIDGQVDGAGRPSSEWRFHRDILSERPEVGAVVHAHPTACTTLAIMGRSIPPIHYMVAACGGRDIRCAPYATFGTEELSRHALAALEGRSACLLAHHGMIATGATLAQAMWRAVEVETLARQYLGCLPLGEPPLLPDAEIEEVRRRMSGYGLAG